MRSGIRTKREQKVYDLLVTVNSDEPVDPKSQAPSAKLQGQTRFRKLANVYCKYTFMEYFFLAVIL